MPKDIWTPCTVNSRIFAHHVRAQTSVSWGTVVLLRRGRGRLQMAVCIKGVCKYVPCTCFVSELLLASCQVNAMFLSLQINHLVARYAGSPVCTILAAMPITLSRRIPIFVVEFQAASFFVTPTVCHCWWHQEGKVTVLATLSNLILFRGGVVSCGSILVAANCFC